MGSPAKATDFFGKLWPEALAIGDPKQKLYRAFDIGIGSVGQFFKPDVWKAYWANRSHGVGAPVGNTMRNPGAIMIADAHVIYVQQADHFGEQVDVEAVKRSLASRA